MNDLVNKLRNSYKTDHLYIVCNEAADEIEHLANRCKHLEAEVARLERLSNG